MLTRGPQISTSKNRTSWCKGLERSINESERRRDWGAGWTKGVIYTQTLYHIVRFHINLEDFLERISDANENCIWFRLSGCDTHWWCDTVQFSISFIIKYKLNWAGNSVHNVFVFKELKLCQERTQNGDIDSTTVNLWRMGLTKHLLWEYGMRWVIFSVLVR